MKYFYKFLILLIAPISMINASAIASVIAAFYAGNIIYNFKNLDFSIIKSRILELVFICWILLSCIWSVDSLLSFEIYLVVLFVYLSLVISLDPRWYYKFEVYKVFALPLLVGIILSIIFFLIEYRTEGLIINGFRELLGATEDINFYLYLLDKGCSVLSLLLWPILFILFRRKKYIFSCFLILISAYIFNLSDSLSTYIAFIAALVTFILSYYSRMLFAYIVVIGFLISIIAIPYFSSTCDAEEINDKYQTIPDSGKHRLFIYNFVSRKALEKPFFGWGFASSSVIPIDEDYDIIYYEQYRWNPLPLHPHNNILQIWLETGIIGLILYGLMVVKFLNRIFLISRRSQDYLWGAISLAASINYLTIGLISYGIWQEWWILLGSFTILLLFLFRIIKKTKQHKELDIRG